MNARGFSLVELLVSVAVSAILLTSLLATGTVVDSVSSRQGAERALSMQADFALQRMVMAITGSERLLLPLNDRPTTSYQEHIRAQHVPAQPPTGDSSFDSAVLAVSQDPRVDLDYDGTADADNDGDGRIDEDWPSDVTNDGEPGIANIDDDGDGSIDEGLFSNTDDDELLALSEDPVNGVDDDDDGSIDEDSASDMNGDGEPGVEGVDDDGDGDVDEGSAADDDEDGDSNEDWLDAHVFFLDGASLMERIPVPWDANNSFSVTGADYVETSLVDNVRYFRVQRLSGAYDDAQLLELQLTLADADGREVSRTMRARVGSDR